MKEKIFPVSSYVAINDEEGDVVVTSILEREDNQFYKKTTELRVNITETGYYCRKTSV